MNKWIYIAIIAALGALLFSGCGGGGGGGGLTLTGRVVDGANSNQPLAGATVSLQNQHTTTAADGTFTLSGLTLGTNTLTVQLNGFEISAQDVTIVAGANTLPADVVMAPVSGNPPGGLPRTIQGTITLTGASNSSGVAVLLLLGGVQVDETTTASDGTYSFWAPVGAYTVRAVQAGFIAQEEPVTVTDLATIVTVNLTLQPG